MRHRCLLEILIVYTVIEAALWTRGDIQFFWIVLAAICVGIMTVRGGRSAARLGLSKPGRGSARILVASVLAAMATIAAGWAAGTLHTFHGRHSPVVGFIVYAAFAFAQEFVLQSFFFVRLEGIFPTGRTAVIAAAVLFCLAHFPNPALLVATFIGGLVFCEAFRRYRNLYPIWAAHLLLGLCVAAAVPDALTHQMKVGLAYLTYR
jgi:membrane protease YdiL (CAAX protease family)